MGEWKQCLTGGSLVIMQLLYGECVIWFEKVGSSNTQSLPSTWTVGVEEVCCSMDEVNKWSYYDVQLKGKFWHVIYKVFLPTLQIVIPKRETCGR